MAVIRIMNAQGKAVMLPPSEQIVISEAAGKFTPELKYPYRAPETTTEWHRWLSVLKKESRWGALVAFTIFVAIAVVTYSIVPVYQSTARLEIEPPGSEAFSLTIPSPGGIDEDYRDTQSEILKSETLALAVIRKLGLDHNATIVGENISARPDAPAGKQSTQLTTAENIALKYYQDHLSVSLVPKSRVLLVKFATTNPRLSAQVVNTLLDLFIEGNYKARYDAIVHASEWLSRQMDDIRDKADTSNQVLASYQKEHGIVDVDEKHSSVSEKIADLNHQLAQAETDRIQFEAYLNGIQRGQQESLPQIRDNLMIQALTQRLIESKAELSQSQAVYGEKSPNIQKLEYHVNELQSQILAEERNIVREIQTNYEAARTRQNLLTREIKGATTEMSEMSQYISLKREAQRDADLYSSLYARIKEAGIAAASKSSNVRVVDQARVLDKPTWPRRRLNLVLGLTLGLFFGALTTYVRGGLDNSIRTVEEVEKWTGLPSLTLVPTTGLVLNGGCKKNGLPVSFFEKPFSPEAEAIRALQASILLCNPENAPRLLLVTSPFPKEGKTTVAINLAVALSQLESTCLIDADFRKPGVAPALHLKDRRGLGNVLGGSLLLSEAQVALSRFPGLVILPAGQLPEDFDQLGVMDRLRKLLQVLKKRWQYIVIDSPPLIPYADGRVLSNVVDGVILVGRYGSTSRQALARCAQMLTALGAPLLGVALNGVDYTSPDYRYYRSAYSTETRRT
jgi:polysaccharide biosynthesis transport protein